MTVVVVVPHMYTFVNTLKICEFYSSTSILVTFKKHTKDLETCLSPRQQVAAGPTAGEVLPHWAPVPTTPYRPHIPHPT